MRWYIGIDLGTSAVKLLLTDEQGHIEKTVSRTYPLHFPRPGWAEQDPEDWWAAVESGLQELTAGLDVRPNPRQGSGGQNHRLVALDENDRVIRPAILWNDGRTGAEVDRLNETVGRERLSAWTANIAFAGFTAPKLLWLRSHEPENFARIRKIMLPKDYINYRLTGVHACDYSDASGTLLLNVAGKCWSREMLELCGLTESQLPKLFESYEVIGTVKAELGLPDTVKVVAGAGDNAAAAIGTGAVGEGTCNLSIGTSGTVFIPSGHFRVDANNALHSFAHADGGYHLMGCTLSAASCMKWLCGDILHTEDYAAEQADISGEKLGRNRVFFLPYLMGERSPINDTDARGTFVGISMDTTRSDLVQAVMEGVAFAIRDSVEAARSLGIELRRATLCGGGARSPLWRRIFADVLDMEIDLVQTEEGPGYGGAMLAMTGCGEYAALRDCVSALVSVRETVRPDPETAARYAERYRSFREIYPVMKPLFQKLRENGPSD